MGIPSTIISGTVAYLVLGALLLGAVFGAKATGRLDKDNAQWVLPMPCRCQCARRSLRCAPRVRRGSSTPFSSSSLQDRKRRRYDRGIRHVALLVSVPPSRSVGLADQFRGKRCDGRWLVGMDGTLILIFSTPSFLNSQALCVDAPVAPSHRAHLRGITAACNEYVMTTFLPRPFAFDFNPLRRRARRLQTDWPHVKTIVLPWVQSIRFCSWNVNLFGGSRASAVGDNRHTYPSLFGRMRTNMM